MANARSFYSLSRSHSGPRHSSYYTGLIYRNGSTQDFFYQVIPSFTSLSIDVQWSASWTSKPGTSIYPRNETRSHNRGYLVEKKVLVMSS